VFQNTGKDSNFLSADTKLYYQGPEDVFFGNLGPNDPPIGVNTFEGHKWIVKVNGEILRTFVITNEERQKYEV